MTCAPFFLLHVIPALRGDESALSPKGWPFPNPAFIPAFFFPLHLPSMFSFSFAMVPFFFLVLFLFFLSSSFGWEKILMFFNWSKGPERSTIYLFVISSFRLVVKKIRSVLGSSDDSFFSKLYCVICWMFPSLKHPVSRMIELRSGSSRVCSCFEKKTKEK